MEKNRAAIKPQETILYLPPAAAALHEQQPQEKLQKLLLCAFVGQDGANQRARGRRDTNAIIMKKKSSRDRAVPPRFLYSSPQVICRRRR